MKAKELAEALLREPEAEVYIERSNGTLVRLTKVRATYVKTLEIGNHQAASVADGGERSIAVSA